MNTIFHITGGLGKHVLSSSIINSYKSLHPDSNIIIASAYPDIFSRNPNVYESLNLSQLQYFYKNYIHNKDITIFAHDPYRQTSHILKQKHLIDTWCDMIGIESIAHPTIHPNFRELEIVGNKINSISTKPILIFQPFGGPPNSELPYCWARDLHPTLAQKIVNYYKDKYTILHICNPQHPTLENCNRIDNRMHPMMLFAMLLFSEKRILIDSCLQHASHALGLSSEVFWITTSPKIFGYPTHNNIVTKTTYPEGHVGSYLFDYEITGIIPECPYVNSDQIFKFDEIIDLL
jgi:hypothetical protein